LARGIRSCDSPGLAGFAATESAMAHAHIFSFQLFMVLAQMFVAWVVMVWLWGIFLDKYEHDPGRVRAAMFAILAVASIVETSLSLCSVTHWWVAVVALVVNVWGGVDALLRYPAAHQIESFFVLKQFALLVVKTFTFAVGMVHFKDSVVVMVAALPGHIWGLPLLYLMALPMDPAEQVVKDDAYNVDLAVRVWKIAVCSSERRECIDSCRGWVFRRLCAASERSPLARKLAICAASPKYGRTLRRVGRSV